MLSAAGSAMVRPGLQVVVDVVSAHVRVHVDELLRRDLRVQQGLQPILDAHGIQWAVRKAIAERLFDRPQEADGRRPSCDKP